MRCLRKVGKEEFNSLSVLKTSVSWSFGTDYYILIYIYSFISFVDNQIMF